MYMWCVEFSERSGRHIKTCLSCHHSLCPCSATRISPLLKPSSFVFVVQIEKKSMASVHLFLRPDINNISPLRAFFRRKKLIVCMYVYIYIYIYIYIYSKGWKSRWYWAWQIEYNLRCLMLWCSKGVVYTWSGTG